MRTEKEIRKLIDELRPEFRKYEKAITALEWVIN